MKPLKASNQSAQHALDCTGFSLAQRFATTRPESW
jgi:hypothetical protein